MEQDANVVKSLLLAKITEEIEDYAIILLDVNGNIENWNKGAEQIKGYTSAEILGRNFRQFYTLEDRLMNLPERMLENAAEFGKATNEGWRIRKDNTRFWASVLITAIHDEERNVIGFVKVTRDLTATRTNERLLRKNEERYQKMIAEVKDYAIILLDVNGNIENWNLGAQNIKGYMPAEIVGRNFSVFYTEKDREEGLPFHLLDIARKEGRVQHESWRVKKDGTLFWGLVSITALHSDEGIIIGFVKVTRDLTEKKLTEQKIAQYISVLERQNKELEQFTYIASHDLQEPLRTLSSFSDLLHKNEEHNLGAESQYYLSVIMQSADRMRSLVKGLLDYSRIGREKELSEVDCNQLVQDVITDLYGRLSETGGTVLYDGLPVIKAYAVELRLLFQNLISNAIKFHRKDLEPQVKITATEKEDCWEFAVADNGIGIDEKYQDRVFLIFQRLHSRNEYEGSGIGLSHSKKIADLHQGNIWFTSVPGEGTCFYFTIPFKISQ